ncbi:nitroreductase [Bacillus sp. Marseille-Q1617]|uniref:nitroreductase family protein n=1 Tax=Bacillus sp. Marseille-Q1617 TaxID=2736887 RepID=UPI001589344C|nr:nitroreductase [Bacillus sp. Marseille-Q1617]
MDIFEAIQSRRSMGLVKDDPVPKDVIEKILEAGNWAPSHHRTEPWRFFVLTGEGRKPLGEALVKAALENMDDPEGEESKKKLEKTAAKPLRAPLIIAVAVEPSDNPKVIEIEEYGAAYAATQNMLLAAHALGLAGIWRTGKPCYHVSMNELFGLSDRGKMLGFLYFGYPKRESPAGKRKEVSGCVKWLGDEIDFDQFKKKEELKESNS